MNGNEVYMVDGTKPLHAKIYADFKDKFTLDEILAKVCKKIKFVTDKDNSSLRSECQKYSKVQLIKVGEYGEGGVLTQYRFEGEDAYLGAWEAKNPQSAKVMLYTI